MSWEWSEHTKKWIFIWLQKLAEMTWTWYGAAECSSYKQRWSATVDSHVRQTDRQWWRRHWSNPEVRGLEEFINRVHGAVPWQHLKARMASLYTETFLELWANVAGEGAHWCGRTSTMKTPLSGSMYNTFKTSGTMLEYMDCPRLISATCLNWTHMVVVVPEVTC